MMADFEETLQKIDDELGLNSAAEDSVSILVTIDAPLEIPSARDSVSHSISTQLLKPEGKDHPIGPILLPNSVESPQAKKKGLATGLKPKEQGTWVRIPRATKTPNKDADVRGTEGRRDPIQTTDPRPSKCLNASQDAVLCTLPAAVADVQPRRKP